MLVIKFEDLVEQMPVEASIRANYVKATSLLYAHVARTYRNRKSYKQSTVNKLNYLVFCLRKDSSIPYNWKDIVEDDNFCYDEDEKYVSRIVKHLFLDVENVDWSNLTSEVRDNIFPEPEVKVDRQSNVSMVGTFEVRHTNDSTLNIPAKQQHDVVSPVSVHILEEPSVSERKLTPKEDLFIVTPKYPRVADFHHRYGNIHVSLPQVPTRQCEVSCTTDVNCMTDSQLLNLFPNNFIRTRSSVMYKPKDGITLDPHFGLLIPVDGFTDAEVRDCIIRYPHIFKLKRVGPDGDVTSFYSHIEIDGELVDTMEAWSFLPEARLFDFDSMSTRQEQLEFMKEYAIRRYLLERDVKGVVHKYPVVGDLPEFVTLFMPSDMYSAEGFKDVVQLARKCVQARVDYIRSRNPRLNNEVTVTDCVFDSFCTKSLCDRSCPQWAQMDYLMMRNGLTSSSRPFKMKMDSLQKYIDLYEAVQGSSCAVVCSDPVKSSEVMSYVSVCNNWNGSAMRVRSYHLLFSKYIQSVQAGWNGKKSDETDYMDIWSKSSNVLVVSDVDYVNFKDFQSQALLQLMQDREREGKTTIIFCPKLDSLSGSGKLFNLLVSKLRNISRTVE